jgi:hypothetical protein
MLDEFFPPVAKPTQKVCLTALIPQALEIRAVDWLLMHPNWSIEFSVHAVAARGPLVQLGLDEERVQGFAQRIELKLIIDRSLLDELLGELTELMSGVAGGYWVLPVEQFSAFAAKQARADTLQ